MSWQGRVGAGLGTPVRTALPVHGGDLSDVYRAELEDGRRVAVKLGDGVGREARMLQAIARTGAAAPTVLWTEEDLLCLQWLEETRATPEAWQSLGETLRRLHAPGDGAYGWPEDHAFAAVPIPNDMTRDWPPFWAERRLLPFLRVLPDDLARRVAKLCGQLRDRLPEAPAPALLHGDLWTGNALFSGAKAYLIDPACYRGDAEVDLGMLTLFGQPDRAFWTGYGAPAPDWETRRPIYQLWPALVHLSLFGAGYRGMVTGLLDQAGV